MKRETVERWRELCDQAFVEQDPERLLELCEEITSTLNEKYQRLLKEQPEAKPN